MRALEWICPDASDEFLHPENRSWRHEQGEALMQGRREETSSEVAQWQAKML